jgi:hypothetical protein
MKWTDKKYYREEKRRERIRAMLDWHPYFALFPIAIPEREYDSIVVPAHKVWLEYVERRYDNGWKFRTRRIDN